MALSDCYMLRDFQQWGNETILNVFFYQDILLASVAENVVQAYIDGVIPKVVPLQVNGLTHILIDAVNLADPDNFFEERVNFPGTSGSGGLPLFNAYTFALRLNTRRIRPGSKRIAGVNDSAQSDGILIGDITTGAVEAYRIQMKSILQLGLVDTFQPIVIKRVKYNPDPTDLTHFAYRLPENDAEFVFGNVVECLTTNRVSHQSSRGNAR